MQNPTNTNKWENVAEGDVLKICEDEFFPADCVVIATSESNGACYIETKSIDGETNLKFKTNLCDITKHYILYF